MPYDPRRHHRRSIRLKGYDYARPGAYFVTLCAHHRECLFGEIVDGEMRLTPAGEMVLYTWHDLVNHVGGIALDEFVVMPNHVHGIIVIVGPDEPVAGVGTGPGAASVGTGPGAASVGTGPGAASVGTGPGAASVGTGPGTASVGTGPGAASVGTGSEPVPTDMDTDTGLKRHPLPEIVRQLKTFSARRINAWRGTPGALLVLAASDRLGSAFSLPVLRFLEGYWPGPLRRLAAWKAARRRARVQKSRYRWNALIQKRENAPLPWQEARELARLESERRSTPRDLDDVMPTRFGDVLRAAETRPRQRYGLDPVLLWPHLWLSLPDAARQDLSAARAALDRLAEAWLWGLLFALWSFAWPWAWVIALAWMAIVYELLVQAARPFADLLLAAFDTQRWALYQSMRWPPPASSDAEPAAGAALTRFVQRGMVDAPVAYHHP